MFAALHFLIYLLNHNLNLKIVFVANMAKHVSIYSVRANITTPGPVSCLMIIIILLFFDNRSITFLCLFVVFELTDGS